MEDKKMLKTPSDVLVRMQVVRLGKILFCLQFVAISVMYASLLTIIAYPFYYVILVSIAILTLFSIFAWSPGFKSWWNPVGLNNMFLLLAKSWKFTVPIALILSIAAFACLCFDKYDRHVKKKASCVLICVLAIIYLILRAAVLANN